MSTTINDYQQKHVSYCTVIAEDLPFHCPPKDAQKWNMHPKVFIKFDKDGQGACPYCGASYELN